MARWYGGYHYCTTSFKKLYTKVMSGSIPACGESEVCYDENRLKIKLNAFHRSTHSASLPVYIK